MKHGPIALIDEEMPVVAIATRDAHLREDPVATSQEVKARGGIVIAVATEGDISIQEYVDYVVYVPAC